MQGDWKQAALNHAVQKTVLAITAAMSAAEVEQANQTYLLLFRHDLDALGELNQEIAISIFADKLAQKLNQIAPLALDGRRKLLQEDSFVSRVMEISDFVERIGQNLINGEPLTPDVRSKIVQARNSLNELAPKLRAFSSLDQQTGLQISESLLDCRFILEGGEPSSLRLHKYSDYVKLQKTQ
ncbi:MAG: hypothetical protein WA621_17800 [Candidatus Acidiferrum sp.]